MVVLDDWGREVVLALVVLKLDRRGSEVVVVLDD